MKRRAIIGIIAGVALTLSFLAFASDKKGQDEAPASQAAQGQLKTEKARMSYALGMQLGMNLKTISQHLDIGAFLKGIKDTHEGKQPLLSQQEAAAAMQKFQAAMQEEQTKQREELMKARQGEGAKNKKEGEAFLAKNKKGKGVVATASGLQYVVLKEGTGAKPKKSDTVKIHYRGTLIGGKEFDSSYKRNEPAVFPLTGVFPGFAEALQLMKVGSKYKLFVPAALAYGERGAGSVIGPNSTLVFEVELLGIEPPEKKEGAVELKKLQKKD